MKKKFTSMISFVFVLLMVMQVGIAYAANTSDTSFEFLFGNTSFTQYTASRRKDDTSPAYMYVQNHTGDIAKVAAVKGNYGESSYTPIIYIPRTGTYCISSNVYEDGARALRLRVQKYNTFSAMYLKGLWSPDSWSCK